MPLIDWDLLLALKDDIGEDDFAEVVALFVAEIEEKLTELRDAPGQIGADDFHFLRGSAANLGFVAMGEACGAAEKACRHGATPDLDAVIAAFDAALVEARPRLPELQAA